MEPLWMSRFDDILSGLETMREADLTNQPTIDAGRTECPARDNPWLAKIDDQRGLIYPMS